MATVALEFTEGDTIPNIVGTAKNNDGSAMNITGFTFKLHIGYEIPLVKTATILSPAGGTFSFAWGANDLVTGIWDASIEIIAPSGTSTVRRIQNTSEVFTINVRPKV
jgi:hypothetical protein